MKTSKVAQPILSAPNICPVCFAHSHFSFLENHSQESVRGSKDSSWSLYECSTCSVQFWIPFRQPERIFYERPQHETQKDISNSVKNNQVRLHWNHKQFFKENFPVGTLLDVGCDVGDFVVACKEKGYSVFGVEPDRYSANMAQQRGVTCFSGYLREYIDSQKQKNSLQQFDYVTFFEVLEHTTSPAEFLADVLSLVKDGGRIVMSVPYKKYTSLVRIADHPPGHYTRWNEQSLNYVLNKAGFKVEHIRIRPFNLRSLTASFFASSAFRIIGSEYIKNVLAVVLGVVTYLPFLLRSNKHGNRVVVIASKKN